MTKVKVPKAKADSGADYSAGLIIFYSPEGQGGGLTATRFTGSVEADGFVTADSALFSSRQAMAGLYLSAFRFVKPDDASSYAALERAIKASGVDVSSKIILLD